MASRAATVHSLRHGPDHRGDYKAVVHRNVSKVVEAGQARGIDVQPLTFPEGTRTAADAALAIGVLEAQIVKSLAFLVDGQVVMALVSGANQLDESKLAAAAGGATAGRADADAVRAATGFPIGGVPPFGHAEVLPVFLDEDLLRHDQLFAAAGTPSDVFAISSADLVTATGAAVCDLARR